MVPAGDSIHRNRKGSHKWLFHVSSLTYSVKDGNGWRDLRIEALRDAAEHYLMLLCVGFESNEENSHPLCHRVAGGVRVDQW